MVGNVKTRSLPVVAQILDSDGTNLIDPAGMSKVYEWNGPNGTISACNATDDTGQVWRKTFGYSGTVMVSESGWVKQ
jgi:hypothetical protein